MPRRLPPDAGPPAPQMSLFFPSATEAPAPGERPEEGAVRQPPAGAAMWQVHDAYLIAETRAGVLIVDQASAHQRVLYEETLAAYDRGGLPAQRLLFPVALRLSPQERALVEELGALFARTGFEIELRDGGEALLHAAPEPHPRFDPESCLRAMLAELTGGSELVAAARSQHQRVALVFAAHGAIRAGQRLSAREMAELFDRLFATARPFEDLHGRPTVVQLPLDELRSRFGR